MRSRTAPDLAGRCRRCRLRIERCLCASVPSLGSPLRFVVIRHALEAIKSTNTTRLAALALPSIDVRERGQRNVTLDLGDLDPADTMLVFPTGSPTGRVQGYSRFVLLDGNWNQARRMVGRLPELQRLPRLSLSPPTSAPLRMRGAPSAEQLSTIEAIAGVLRWSGDQQGAEALVRLYELYSERTLATRGLAGDRFSLPAPSSR